MKKKIFFLFFIIYLSYFYSLPAQPSEPTGRRYRDIVDDKFSDGSLIIGGTTGTWAFGTNTGLLMDREFNYVTKVNNM